MYKFNDVFYQANEMNMYEDEEKWILSLSRVCSIKVYGDDDPFISATVDYAYDAETGKLELYKADVKIK